MQIPRLFVILVALGLVPACTAASYSPDRAEQSPASDRAAEGHNPENGERDRSSPRSLSIQISVSTGDRSLGAYSLLLTFDPDRAELLDVSGPSANEFQPPFHRVLEYEDKAVAVIRLASYDIKRTPSGIVPVADVTFSSSDPPSRFIRNLKVETVSDPEGNPIDASATWSVR